MNKKKNIIIIGCGPAGLIAAYELSNNKNFNITLVEKYNKVGGLARTEKLGENLYDIGPHRFYTKNDEIIKLFKRFAGKDLIKVKRLTRIFYSNLFFDYPLSPFNTLIKLGFIKSFKILGSYIFSKLKINKINNFEDYIIKNFGNELYRTFFKTYTEKIWGIPCSQISSSWASQRIKNLNILQIIKSFFKKQKNIKSLVDEFFYLKNGAGNLYENIEKILVKKKNVKIIKNTEAIKYFLDSQKNITKIKLKNKSKYFFIKGEQFFVSAPLTETIKNFNIVLDKNIQKILKKFRYRSHIGVKLNIKGKTFKDNWIYIHNSNVKVARISNYKNFSPQMIKNKDNNALTLEYFVNESDRLWKMDDNKIIRMAVAELKKIKICSNPQPVESFVIKSKNAYPLMTKNYSKELDLIKKYLQQFKNYHPIGRAGMFKYNNQDHAMATGLIAARKILDPQKKLDQWNVNIDAEYIEEIKSN